MSDLVRFTVSVESDLLDAFDGYVRDGSFATRSEAIRQLLRQTLARGDWEADARDRPPPSRWSTTTTGRTWSRS